MGFIDKIATRSRKTDSLVCVGLDTDPHKIPEYLGYSRDGVLRFNEMIIRATSDFVCAYKPNTAFYEAMGSSGIDLLEKTCSSIPDEIPIILDVKRGDIGNTAKMYAKAVFDYWNADSVTIYPHLGLDSTKPFLDYKDKLIILLIKTSNPDSKMFQDVPVGKESWYYHMSKKITQWPNSNIGFMIGATYPEELKKIRKLFPNSIFLSPGLGIQGGDTEKAVRAGVDKNGAGIMFNASRSILYASKGKDFAEKARVEAKKLRDEINNFRK